MSRVLHDRIAALGSVLVISPHFDDAVFSCGNLLAAHPGSYTMTMFGGIPEPEVSTEWDRAAGFANSTEAVAVRRQEDTHAHAQLCATARHLDFCDSQYGVAYALRDVQESLHRLVTRHVATAVFVPLGLFHSDHMLVSDAALTLLNEVPDHLWVGYEDVLYRRERGAVQRRIVTLAERGIVATPVAPRCASDGKQKGRAVACYVSQLRAFGAGGFDDVHQPERYWLLEPLQGDPNHAVAS